MTVLGLPPGIPALLLLIIMNFTVIIVYLRLNCPVGVNNKLKWFLKNSSTQVRAKATCTIALPFWIWALYKVISENIPDLGAVTFFLVIISCTYVNYVNNYCSLVMLLMSNALVSLNYGLPLVTMTLPFTFNIYLVVGALYWIFMCNWNWRSRKNIGHYVSFESRGEEERLNLY